MKDVKVCKKCGRLVPGGESVVSYACQKLGLCRYCYKGEFPQNHSRRRIKKYLNPYQIRARHLRVHKEIARDIYDPAFFREWLELWEEGV
jgi:ribosome-binding protein aMBF1 (putative translation factor)